MEGGVGVGREGCRGGETGETALIETGLVNWISCITGRGWREKLHLER